jgi:glutamate synthase (NADPH/NADH) small chain
MTAYPHEFAFVKQEGVNFRFLTQPVEVLSEQGAVLSEQGAALSQGKVVGLRCVRTELGPPDASGRRTPVPVPGSEFTVMADQIVKAVGQEKLPFAEQHGLAQDRGYIRVNDELETSIAGVFAGGDCIRDKNAASTVMAVQDGKLAAMAIHRRLAKAEEGNSDGRP